MVLISGKPFTGDVDSDNYTSLLDFILQILRVLGIISHWMTRY